MDRGAWQATVYRVAKESDTTEHACIPEKMKTLIKIDASSPMSIAALFTIAKT